MSNDDDVAAVAKALLEVQGTALACQLIIKALLVKTIMADGNPKAALRKMFDQVSADLDQGQEALAGAQETSISHARRIVEEIFSSFDQALTNRASSRKRGKGPT